MKKSLYLSLKLKCIILCSLLLMSVLVLASCDEPDVNTIPGLFAKLADEADLTLTENAKEFLDENDHLFPATNTLSAIEYSDYDLEYKQIIKAPEKHGDKLMVVGDMYVIQVFETEMTDSVTLTEILTTDTDGNNYYIFYPDSIEIYEGDYISAFMLPLDTYSFENLGGGTTLSLACAGALIVAD